MHYYSFSPLSIGFLECNRHWQPTDFFTVTHLSSPFYRVFECNYIESKSFGGSVGELSGPFLSGLLSVTGYGFIYYLL